jgi:hypothetical protein
MNDMTDTTGGDRDSRDSRDGRDRPPRARHDCRRNQERIEVVLIHVIDGAHQLPQGARPLFAAGFEHMRLGLAGTSGTVMIGPTRETSGC